MRLTSALMICALLAGPSFAADVEFARKPTATQVGGKVTISFALKSATDVEVAVLDAKGKVVRHLAAGVLDGKTAPPAPLKPGLAQSLLWDGKDDFGKAATGAPFKVRVRAGARVTFGRLIGEDPYIFGGINAIATDADGDLYVSAHRGGLNQNIDTLRVFNAKGEYLRTLIPFAADLKPDRITAAAAWNPARKGFVPRNRRSQMPEFYPWGAGAAVVSASKKGGVVLKHGTNLWRTDLDGGNVRGPFPMWSKAAKLKNPRWNVPQLAVSPDGRYIYYSNVAGTRYKPKGHKDFDPRWPQGRIYRQDTQAGGDPQKFYDLVLPDWEQKKYWLPDAWNKRTAAYGITVDAKGHLYVCDLVNQEVVEVDPQGTKVSATKAPWPERVHVDAKTGDYYVICRLRKPLDGYVDKKLIKIVGRGAGAKIVAELPLKKWRGLGAASAIGAVDGKTVLWLGGAGALVCVRDAGNTFELIETNFKPNPYAQADWNRIAVDGARDEVYTSDGGNKLWRYDGKTGRGEILKQKGRVFYGVDLAVGYDGLLYVRTGRSYSGPLQRFSRALEPAPFPSGTHVLSKYIYSRYGVGNCEKGLGVGPKGEAYISFMYGWNQYLVAGFGPDGKPIKGPYLEGVFKPDVKRGAPADLNTAVVGPIPAGSGGIRVGLDGDLYVGVRVLPKGFRPPPGYEKDRAYSTWTGSVVRFGPQGGTFLGLKGAASKLPKLPRVPMVRKIVAEGAKQVYGGLGPMSAGGYGGGGSCCVCRVPRFDVDRYGRIVMPNAVTNSVVIVDNAGNRILEFGRYGNFDSQYVNPVLQKEGEKPAPTVAIPAIPLAWPTGAGCSDKHVYVNDTYNRRIVRVDKVWGAETTVKVE